MLIHGNRPGGPAGAVHRRPGSRVVAVTRLFIAEKPELAKAIVEGLGGGTRADGYTECSNGDIVTWCFGHMLELDAPETPWNMAELPISFIPWTKRPTPDRRKQLTIIAGLLKKASRVVHAGDPDDEGQLLIDEVLEYYGNRAPVQRLLINDNNVKIVRRALETMRDNAEFRGLSQAAEARSVGDLTYGVNLTRAYTLAAQAKGHDGVLSVGRVQTPILGLVVRRDRENAGHSVAYYHIVMAQFDAGGQTVIARYRPAEGEPVDDKGRLTDAALAATIAATTTGRPARIIAAKTTQRTTPPPLPYNLLKLQTDASRRYGYKPDHVKDITQALREKHRLITYNRSDCEYLSDEQHGDASAVLAAIAANAAALATAATRADASIKGRAFDSSKVTAHHAIIPTEGRTAIETLTEAERRVYLLIARAYTVQFWPARSYDHSEAVFEVDGRRFVATSDFTTAPGWTALYQADERGDLKDEGDAGDDDAPLAIDMRSLAAGRAARCIEARAEQRATKPRPLYTIPTLLTDLTRIARYIRDDRLRKMLIERDRDKAGEHGGIGTPATRDAIIQTLYARGFLVDKGKNVVSTPLGQQLYDALPDAAKFPDMTAVWHEQQKAIQTGARDATGFVRQIEEHIAREVAAVKTNGLTIASSAPPCPTCGRALRRFAKGKNGPFWSCTGYGEAEPCKFTAPDKAGKPDLAAKQPVAVSQLHKCMTCGGGLSRREGRKKGSHWWGCSNYPECKQTYTDAKGRPDYSSGRAT